MLIEPKPHVDTGGRLSAVQHSSVEFYSVTLVLVTCRFQSTFRQALGTEFKLVLGLITGGDISVASTSIHFLAQ